MSQLHAVLWDFGGVILASPFEAFNHYERDHGLPHDFIRTVNATNPDRNAWAHLERNQISAAQFARDFADESAALGHRVDGHAVLGLLAGEVRADMVAALDAVKAAGYKTACLTNNIVSYDDAPPRPDVAAALARFDVLVESAKVGVRKPEQRFYEIACELLDVQPAECVFLDDLGINLKTARQMGMTTIKVESSAQARAELGAVLNLAL